MTTANFCSERILVEEFVKDFRIRVVRIVDFRIDRLKSSKDFFNMLFLVADLAVLADLADDEDEDKRSDRML